MADNYHMNTAKVPARNWSRLSLFVSAIGCLAGLTACGKSVETSSVASTSDLSEATNTATEQATSAAQNFDSSSYALLPRPSLDIPSALSGGPQSLASHLESVLLPQAHATACTSSGSTFNNACTGTGPYVNTRTYNSCTLANSLLSLSGSATFSYTNSGCSMMGVTNRSVTRTSNLTMTGKSGGTLAISSESHRDYRGYTIGGGQKLTAGSTAGTYTINVLGMNRKLTSSGGTVVYNISSRTTAPITATGTSLANLTLNGGTLEVIHNKAQYVVAFSMSNVEFGSSCACPISGKMTGAFVGSVGGSTSITYTGCGKATVVDVNGKSSNITVDSCAYP